MNKLTKIVIFLVFILIPYFFIYKVFFTDLPISWGDAPYFYSENLRELFNLPTLWDFRNANFGAPQAGILWLFLPTFLFGLLNYLFAVEHELLIRLIFLIPATGLSLLGTYLFLSRVSQDFLIKLIGSFLYGFNTYFLMVLDGGQIGVGLAYGFFPLVSYFLINFLNKSSQVNFIKALMTLFLLTNIDLRVGLLSIAFSFIWFILENWGKNPAKEIIKRSLAFLVLVISVGLLCSFWLIPFLLNSGEFPGGRFTEVLQSSNFISLLDSFYLYQPHFPLNDFGKVSPPPFYFGLLPILLIIPYLLKGKELKFLIFFLVLVFLAKGTNTPFGEVYNFIISNIPFAQAFRDSTKFYIPLILTAVFLLVISLQYLSEKYFNDRKKIIVLSIIWVYLLLLIHTAVVGSLTGALSLKNNVEDFKNIYQEIKQDNSEFFRTVWFPEVPPLAYSSIQNPALYANRLYQDRPFASIINGDYDLFNFLNNPNFNDWLSLVGGKYLFFPDNERKKIYSKKELEEREIFLDFVNNLEGFEKVDLNTKFPVLKNSLLEKPHIFGTNRMFLIVGGDDVYSQLLGNKDFNLAAQGFIPLESCDLNLQTLQNIDPSSLRLLFYKKEEKDLAMIYLCNQFINTNNFSENKWAVRDTNQYLKWKSELLEKGTRTTEYDLGKGIAFSTEKGEKISFNLEVKEGGRYYLPIRYTTASESAGIKVKFENINQDLKNNDSSKFSWTTLGPLDLNPGSQKIEFINLGGLVILNTLGIIKDVELTQAEDSTRHLQEKIESFDLEKNREALLDDLDSEFIKVSSRAINPTEYRVNLPSQINWLIFTDHYHPKWVLKANEASENSIKSYSMLNAFYVPDHLNNKEAKIYFKPQDQIPLAIKISAASLIVIVLFLLFQRLLKKH